MEYRPDIQRDDYRITCRDKTEADGTTLRTEQTSDAGSGFDDQQSPVSFLQWLILKGMGTRQENAKSWFLPQAPMSGLSNNFKQVW